MIKKDFLLELKKNLKDLSEEEVKDVISYYNEYLSELNIREQDEVSNSILSVEEVTSEILNQGVRNLARRIEETTYTEEEIKELENEVIFPKVTILKEILNIDDNIEKRKEVYYEIESRVERRLINDEKIVLKTIIAPSPKVVAGPATPIYYEAIFLTNERMFVFYMDYEYKEIDKPQIYNIEDIKSISKEENSSGAIINFKNNKTLTLRAYRKADKKLALIMLKYLTENDVEFVKEKEFDVKKYVWISLSIAAIAIIVCVYNVIR